MASGILGLSESIDACYRQTRVARNENSAKYCIALDFLTVIVGLEMHAEGEDKWSVVHKRALEILLAVNIQEGAEEIISRSALIANGAAEEILRAKSKSTTDAPIPPDSRSYLYYVLGKNPTYRATWNTLLSNMSEIPLWLKSFSQTYNGVCIPMRLVDVGGTSYESYSVCMPHDCSNNRFTTFFTRDAKQAWGALIVDGGAPMSASQNTVGLLDRRF
jgi:hypothetical protein